MFLKNSRYFGLETIETRDHHGRPVRAVKSRGLSITPGRRYSVLGHDQLDVMSEQRYQDAAAREANVREKRQQDDNGESHARVAPLYPLTEFR